MGLGFLRVGVRVIHGRVRVVKSGVRVTLGAG